MAAARKKSAPKTPAAPADPATAADREEAKVRAKARARQSAAKGGKKPSAEQLAAALKDMEWDSPAGKIKMALADGHQAIQDTAIGKTRWDAAKKIVMIEDIQRFPAECVNPPADMKGEDWIKAGFPNAKSCP